MENRMARILITGLALLGTISAHAQDMTDLQRAAQRLTASMPVDEFKQEIVAKGYSEEEAQEIVTPALSDFGMCMVNSLLDQARSQGISEEAMLKGLTDQPLTPVEEMDANRLDREAFLVRMETCQRSLYSDLDVPKLGLYQNVE